MTSKSASRLAPPSFHAGPLPFVTFDQSSQQFKVEEFACKLLSQINGRIAVICVSGDSKDTLLNRLIGLPPAGGAPMGFEQVSPNHSSDIWMWGQPVQLGENFFAVLISAPSPTADPKSVAISLALSSLYIYVHSDHHSLSVNNRIEPFITVSQIEQVLRGDGPNDVSPPPKVFAVFRDQRCGLSKILDSEINGMSGNGGELIRSVFPLIDCWTITHNNVNIEKFIESVYLSAIDSSRVASEKTDLVINGQIMVHLAQQYCHLLNLSLGAPDDPSLSLPTIPIPCLNEAWNGVVQLQLKSALREAIGTYRSILSEEGMKKLPLSDSQIFSVNAKAKSAAKTFIPRYLIKHLQRVSASSSGSSLSGFDPNTTTGDVNESLTATDVGSWELFNREFKLRRCQLLDHLKNENNKVALEQMEKIWIEMVKSKIDPILRNSFVAVNQLMDLWNAIVAEFHGQCMKTFPSAIYLDFIARSMIPSMLGLSANCLATARSSENMSLSADIDKERLMWQNRMIQMENHVRDQKSVYEDMLGKKEQEIRVLRDMCGSPTPTLAPDNSNLGKIREILMELKNSDAEKKMLQVRSENEQNLIQLERKFNKQLNEARRRNELLIDNVKNNYELEINQLKEERMRLVDSVRTLETDVSLKQAEVGRLSALISANENDRNLRTNFANVINQQSELVLQFLKNKTVLDHNQLRELENLRSQATAFMAAPNNNDLFKVVSTKRY